MYLDKSLQFQISLISNISIVNSPQKKKFFCCLKKIFNGSLQDAFFQEGWGKRLKNAILKNMT